jgi:hypothetical protein
MFGSNLGKVVNKAAYGLSQVFSFCEGESLDISLKQFVTILFQILIYEGHSNENLKSAIKIQNTAPLSCKLTIMILMV